MMCQTCRFYFNSYKIRSHHKICSVLYRATGRRNNIQIISRLNQQQQNMLIRELLSGNTGTKNNQIINNQKVNTQKTGIQQVNKSNIYYNRQQNNNSANSNINNKYPYKSLHQARTRSPQTQSLIPYRPDTSSRNDGYGQNKQRSYSDTYSQRQLAFYNRKNVSNKLTTRFSDTSREKNDTRNDTRNVNNDSTVQKMLNWKNQSRNITSSNFAKIPAIMNQTIQYNIAKYTGQNVYRNGYGQNRSSDVNNSNSNTSRALVPYNISNSRSLIPLSVNFDRMVYGKNIALVGPSKSAIGRNQGAYIDTADLIVRLNKSLPIPKKRYHDIGSRTDIIYNSLNTSDYPGENTIHPEFFLNNGVKYVCSPYPNIYPFKNDITQFMLANRGTVPFRYIDLGLYQKMENIMKTRPYTGTCAILDLLKFNINKLFITGLDFYATNYYSEYRNLDKNEIKKKRKNNIHDAGPQIELIRNVTLFDNRVIPDKVLDIILFRPYRNVIKSIRNSFNPKSVWINSLTGKQSDNTTFYHWITNVETTDKPTLYLLGDKISEEKWKILTENK